MDLRRVAAAAALFAGATALVPLAATPATAVSDPEVVAEGLNNPYKLAFGPDGALYVAEAGTGGEAGGESCAEVETPEASGEACAGPTGSVTRIDLSGEEPSQERVVEGLASFAATEGEGDGAVGPTSVTFGADGTMYVILGLGGNSDLRGMFGDAAEQLGTIVAVPEGEDPAILADLVAFEEAENPDAELPEAVAPDSNPFDLIFQGGRLLAVDAGGNDVLSVDPDSGDVELVGVLPFGQTEAPPFLELPPGTQIPYQPVPTGIADGEHGLLVSQLTGFPFPPGAANVFALDPEAEEPFTVAEEGFTNIIDVAQGPDGSVYVLQFSAEGLLNEPEDAPPTSRLVQIRPDGTRKVLLQDELLVPAGVTVGPDGMVYVTNGSQFAGGGTVIRVDPTVARDPATAAACDPVAVPGANFLDVGGDVHRESIDCAAFWGLVQGVGEGSFAPSQAVTRGQVATILLGVLEAAGVDVPADPPDAFDDDEGNVHEGSLNALAALGILQGVGQGMGDPNGEVSRGQLASLLAAVYEEVTGAALPAGDDAFDDDDGTVHEASIDAVAAAGWITGKSAGVYAPSDPTTRGQLASLVARMLATLVEEGHVEVPAAG